MEKENQKKYSYEITLEREVLREKSAGVLADIDREIDKMCSDEAVSELKKRRYVVRDIYRNVFESEYNDMKRINQAHEKLNETVAFLKK